MKSAKLGQNFLVNRSLAQKIAEAALPVEGPLVEIGPGKGILTESLLNNLSAASHPRLTAIEIDNHLADKLQERFPEDLDIIRQDVLKLRLYEVFPELRVDLVGNIPYYISKDLGDWLIANHSCINKGVFMLQKEFVDKLIRMKQSPQSLMFDYLFQSRILFDVSPGSFNPPPKVTSSVFRFVHRPSAPAEGIDIISFYRLLKISFQNRRKTILNNLSPGYPKQTVFATLTSLDIPPTIRAEQLSLQNFLELYLNLKGD